MAPGAISKTAAQPISLLFGYMQNRKRVQIWLYEDVTHRIEGYIIGFDEYMNTVLDEAEEYNVKTKNRTKVGKILLKGDNITLVHVLQDA